MLSTLPRLIKILCDPNKNTKKMILNFIWRMNNRQYQVTLKKKSIRSGERGKRGRFSLQDIKAYFKFQQIKLLWSWYTSGQTKYTKKYRSKYSMDLAYNKGETKINGEKIHYLVKSVGWPLRGKNRIGSIPHTKASFRWAKRHKRRKFKSSRKDFCLLINLEWERAKYDTRSRSQKRKNWYNDIKIKKINK